MLSMSLCQGYVTSKGIQGYVGVCSCMSVMSVTWTRKFRSPGLWDKFDLTFILSKGYQLLKFIEKFR